MFCLANSSIVMIDLFSAHADTIDKTASKSTLQETSLHTCMVTRSKNTHRSKSPQLVPVPKPRSTCVTRAQK